MYNLKPVGKFLLQICTTTPCQLRGAEQIMAACKKHLGIELNETTIDEFFTIKEVECLGACVNAPIVQINDDYYEDLSAEKIIEILQMLKEGRKVEIGSQTGRNASEPLSYNHEEVRLWLKPADKIFTNLYGFADYSLAAAKSVVIGKILKSFWLKAQNG